MKSALIALSLAFLVVKVPTAQQPKPFEPENFSVFYLLPASGPPVELERQMPNQTLKRGKLQLSIQGEKSPVRISAGGPTEFVVRVTETFKAAEGTLQLFRLDPHDGTREFSTKMPTNRAGNLGNGIKLSAKPYGSSSLKVAPVMPLAPGEYCVSRTTIPTGFCFGIDPVTP